MSRRRPKARDIALTIGKIDDSFRSCLTKKKYNSAKGARMAVEMHPDQAGCRYYYCESCLGWHTTKIPLKKWEQMKR